MRIGPCSTALGVLMLAAATPVIAQTQTAAVRFRVPAGPLQTALPLFAAQSGEQILYSTDLVAGRQSPGVTGSLNTDRALTTLLEGTGLRARRTSPNTLVVFDPSTRAAVSDEATEIEDVIVTGSLIRGVADGPSPVVSVTRDQMDRQGRATVAQLLAALPQNFGGSANEGAINNGGDRSGTNSNYANGVNLRGLGSDATLVLINGRRLAGTGSKGDFVDISTIPTAAVERVDILLDGASALYGADAVGGVVNIVLRDNYDGAETRVRVGNTADGASGEYQIAQVLGRRWASGSAMLTYEYNDRDALAASERRRASDADHTWLGGRDRRSFYSNPGNIVVLDPATGSQVPRYSIPDGQNGVGLLPSDFRLGQTNLENFRAMGNVLPRQTRQSAYAAARQSFGDRFEFSGDARWGLREYETVSTAITTLLTVTRANPYFASPTGANSHTIAYSFQGEIAAPKVFGEVESFGASLGGTADLFRDWRLESYVSYSTEDARTGSDGALQSTNLREALGAIADSPATSFSTARDGFFNPFGSGASNSATILNFISAGYTRSQSQTGNLSANLQISGTVVELPGGPLRLATGLNFRQETFERQVTTFSSGTVPTVGARTETERDVSAAFAELRVPIFGETNALPGLQRLELSLAARFEDYGDIGQTTSPKAGVLWEPTAGLLLRANYGRSFRAPALRELNDAASASPSILPRGSSQILSMILYGGNPNLEPEEADTWTAGFEIKPGGVPGLRLGVNVFRTDFDNRIGQPALESILTALSDPSLVPFVRPLDPANNAADRAAVQAILDLPTTNLRDLFPATSYGAIVDARYVNTARVQVEGLDLSAGYGFSLEDNAFDLDANLTWLERFDAQPTPTSPTVSQLDRPNFPVGLRGRTSASWSRGSWTVAPSLNYVSDYADLTGRRIGSWTTADVLVRFAPDAGLLEGTAVSLTVQNLFDRDPPFYDAPEGIAYDAANANVLGRFISLQLTKSW